jgi:tRNA A-37 threonylcarbamoyl transferase component Bud32
VSDRTLNRSEIFARVLESAPDRRATVLDDLCGDHPELRREIEELVAAAERAISTGGLRAAMVDPPPLQPGTQVGPYVVEREIDRGGMSIIYRATDTVLHRPAVLKTSRFARDPRFRSRLEQEARLAARLSGHPNIAVIYGLVHENDDVYIAQELVEGVTLRQALARGPLPVDEALAAAAAIAGAMAAAHAAGIVHRDLKPENIMRLSNGTLKVLDFGIAKLDAAALETSLEQGLTLPGEAIGTPGYASPEQLLGRPVDRRSDVFSFGIVLYEMLTGRHPFGDSPRFAAALDDPDPLPAEVARAVPPAVVEILQRCLRRSPASRYESGADLERDLRHAVNAGTGPLPLRGSPAGPVWWWQFHLFTASLVNALIVLALWHARGWWPTWRLQPGTPDFALITVFFVPLGLACLTGTLRFNLAFTLRNHPNRIEGHYRRVRRWLKGADGTFAGLTALAALLIAADHPSWATLLIACAVSIVTVAFVIEPNTAEEAIEAVRGRRGTDPGRDA